MPGYSDRMQEDRAFAVELARAAGALTLEYFGKPDLAVELKANNTFFPPHRASSLCQSGGHNHCTCDTCF